MPRVIAFEPKHDKTHQKVLRALAAGIPGAVVRPVECYEPCDVAIIFGGVSKTFPETRHKQVMIDRHKANGSLLVAESAFIKRGQYYQVGWGGSAGHADFHTGPETPLDRWEKLGADMRPWRIKPTGPIVVCGQLPRDVQVQDTDHKAWCRETVAWYHDRGFKVWFRPHPKVNDPSEYGVPEIFHDSKRRQLTAMLDIARCFVTWNSTSGVDAGVAGVPVIACDRGSMAWDVASHDLSMIDCICDRRAWFAKLGYAQWTVDEMKEGLPWKHLTFPR